MTILPFASQSAEEWIDRFDPQKRSLTGDMYLFLKRVMDVTLVLLSIPLWVPALAIIGLAIRFTSPGAPVIFRQLRTGKGGSRFQMYKFRTMVPNAEALKSKYMHLNELQWPDFKITNDPRITRIGKFLRKTSLDELPQFFNVLRREMSLVGPRMITQEEVAKYSQWDINLLTVRPGISGLWQVSGRSDVSYDERVQMDMYYVRNWSIWLDLQIAFQTPMAIIKSKGAY